MLMFAVLPFPVQFHSLQAEPIALLVLHMSSSFNYYLFILFYMYGCSYICVPHVCVVPTETRRGCLIT